MLAAWFLGPNLQEMQVWSTADHDGKRLDCIKDNPPWPILADARYYTDEVDRLARLSNELLNAVDEIDVERVRRLLSEGAMLNKPLIRIMAAKHSLELLELFWAYGLDLNECFSEIEPPILA